MPTQLPRRRGPALNAARGSSWRINKSLGLAGRTRIFLARPDSENSCRRQRQGTVDGVEARAADPVDRASLPFWFFGASLHRRSRPLSALFPVRPRFGRKRSICGRTTLGSGKKRLHFTSARSSETPSWRPPARPTGSNGRAYTGKPTYIDQIGTSLETVGLGFLIATIIAVPLGIASGLSRSFNGAINPLIQIFKPVSPLAWLPIVTMIVSALYVDPVDWLSKSLLISAVTVTLCSMWPTLINTALGVASVDKDLMNVGRVLQLPTLKTVTKLVLPSSLPLIFTGLRLSLGVGWMVLIAAEMLAQNPGLGKFVWDEFQNGSSQSLAKIMVAVLYHRHHRLRARPADVCFAARLHLLGKPVGRG